ncbi:alpha/beta fold hydrolase [Gemmatimonas groenlandica]|uniref:Alpha/beta hydrolase n=1 Tax=Gemmatimonas groenlandica TaxID=2732249 RepID=A0A6M4IVR6_9BACT|nr:alpha/beta hydrolase [Gemmatimonas groenlandica]QJR37697.1 alpha/beta hydrolase [Gemmatimonas groenlandica]
MRTDEEHVTLREHHVPVPGGQLFVREWIPRHVIDGAAPLVLLHDSLGSVELWREFPVRLARTVRRRVIAYDRLGFGRSSSRREPPSLRFIEEEAELYFPAVRRALGFTNFSLFGHSVGGGMSIVIAATMPDVCERLVSESAQSFLEAHTLDGIRAAKRQFENPAYFAKLSRFHGDKAQWVLDAWTETWTSPAFADWSLDPYLTLVRCPTLVIHGDADEFGSVEFPRRIARGVQGVSQLEIIEGCGHVPHREQPDRILSLVTEFL